MEGPGVFQHTRARTCNSDMINGSVHNAKLFKLSCFNCKFHADSIKSKSTTDDLSWAFSTLMDK